MLRVTNSLTRQKEEFVPLVPGKVGMYVCGPTVYDLPHLGHAVSYVAFDLIAELGGEIAVILEQMLLHRKKHAYRLDGDNIRMGLNKNLGFSAEDRAENIRRIGEVAKLFADAGVIAIMSFISPYRKDRDAVRASMKPGEFVEVYVNVSLEAAEKRDPKGLYKKARAGQIKGFTGIDDPYEAPEKAEIVIDTETMKPEVAAERLLKYLEERGYLKV